MPSRPSAPLAGAVIPQTTCVSPARSNAHACSQGPSARRRRMLSLHEELRRASRAAAAAQGQRTAGSDRQVSTALSSSLDSFAPNLPSPTQGILHPCFLPAIPGPCRMQAVRARPLCLVYYVTNAAVQVSHGPQISVRRGHRRSVSARRLPRF